MIAEALKLASWSLMMLEGQVSVFFNLLVATELLDSGIFIYLFINVVSIHGVQQLLDKSNVIICNDSIQTLSNHYFILFLVSYFF